MRTALHSVIILLLLCTTKVHAQYNDIERTELSAIDVPEQVIRAHQLKFPGAFSYDWVRQTARFVEQEENTLYVVQFKKDGRMGHKAFYDTASNFVAYVGFMPNVNLPEVIQDTASQFLNGSYIKSGEVIELGEPYMFIYRVRMNSQGLLKYIYFDKYGNAIDKRKIEPIVFSFI